MESFNAILKKEEVNIRQNLGEAVPTIIFKQIAHKIDSTLSCVLYSEQEIHKIIEDNDLTDKNKFLKLLI